MFDENSIFLTGFMNEFCDFINVKYRNWKMINADIENLCSVGFIIGWVKFDINQGIGTLCCVWND